MIAKISTGSGFLGTLEYLMQQKPETAEREQQRGQEGQQKEAERTSLRDLNARGQSSIRGDHERDELRDTGHQGKQVRAQERETPDPHPPHKRDLAEFYEEGQRHRIVGGNLSGQTPRELAREFGAIRAQRPDIEKPVHHVSISAGENDRLTVQQWQEIAEHYIKEMKFENSPYVVIQHRDGKHDHIHIVASRVDAHGQVVSEWQSKNRAEEIMRGLEEKYDLERVKPSGENLRALPTRGERETFNRTGRLSAKMSMQGRIELALKDAPTVTEFIERLQQQGIETIPNAQTTGRVSGISFRQGKELMKGSNLGRGYSWQGLQNRGLDYDPVRDQPAIEAAKQRAEMNRDQAHTVAPPARSFAETAKEVGQSIGKSAGQYLLDQVNPVNQLERLNPLNQIENQIRAAQTIGRGIAEGYSITKDLLTWQNTTERLQQAAGLDPNSRDAVERLHQAAGVEPIKDEHEVIERLNKAAGLERDNALADQTNTLGKALEPAPELTPTLEHAAAQEVEEHVIEQTLELLL